MDCAPPGSADFQPAKMQGSASRRAMPWERGLPARENVTFGVSPRHIAHGSAASGRTPKHRGHLSLKGGYRLALRAPVARRRVVCLARAAISGNCVFFVAFVAKNNFDIPSSDIRHPTFQSFNFSTFQLGEARTHRPVKLRPSRSDKVWSHPVFSGTGHSSPFPLVSPRWPDKEVRFISDIPRKSPVN